MAAIEWPSIIAEAATWAAKDIERKMNRFSHSVLTRQNLFMDARKIRDVPVCGDTIAKLREGERFGSDS